MEILNILYNNNLIAVYLIGAILIVILIFIVISSINTTPKKEDKILEDPIKPEDPSLVLENNNDSLKKEIEDLPKDNKINDMVNDLYQKSLNQESEKVSENKDLNTVLQEFDVPKSVIEDVVKEEQLNQIPDDNLEENNIEQNSEDSELNEIETPKLKEEKTAENIEGMLKRLYDLRQSEKESQRNSLINEIIDLKKELDEILKDKNNNYELSHHNTDSKELAEYYLFNKDIEFPKLK